MLVGLVWRPRRTFVCRQCSPRTQSLSRFCSHRTKLASYAREETKRTSFLIWTAPYSTSQPSWTRQLDEKRERTLLPIGRTRISCKSCTRGNTGMQSNCPTLNEIPCNSPARPLKSESNPSIPTTKTRTGPMRKKGDTETQHFSDSPVVQKTKRPRMDAPTVSVWFFTTIINYQKSKKVFGLIASSLSLERQSLLLSRAKRKGVFLHSFERVFFVDSFSVVLTKWENASKAGLRFGYFVLFQASTATSGRIWEDLRSFTSTTSPIELFPGERCTILCKWRVFLVACELQGWFTCRTTYSPMETKFWGIQMCWQLWLRCVFCVDVDTRLSTTFSCFAHYFIL